MVKEYFIFEGLARANSGQQDNRASDGRQTTNGADRPSSGGGGGVARDGSGETSQVPHRSVVGDVKPTSYPSAADKNMKSHFRDNQNREQKYRLISNKKLPGVEWSYKHCIGIQYRMNKNSAGVNNNIKGPAEKMGEVAGDYVLGASFTALAYFFGTKYLAAGLSYAIVTDAAGNGLSEFNRKIGADYGRFIDSTKMNPHMVSIFSPHNPRRDRSVYDSIRQAIDKLSNHEL